MQIHWHRHRLTVASTRTDTKGTVSRKRRRGERTYALDTLRDGVHRALLRTARGGGDGAVEERVLARGRVRLEQVREVLQHVRVRDHRLVLCCTLGRRVLDEMQTMRETRSQM
jgi:hypothetical protein